MRKLGGYLQKQGGLPDAGIPANQDQTARHDSSTQHTIELIHVRLGPVDINRSDLSQLHGPGLFACQGNTGMLDFCGLYLLNKRRPRAAVRTAAEILGRMVFTILTDKGRFFLSDDKPLSISLSHIQSLGKNQSAYQAQTDGSACDELQGLLSGNLDTLPYSLQNEPSSPQPSHTE